jgi:hypothetical protein
MTWMQNRGFVRRPCFIALALASIATGPAACAGDEDNPTVTSPTQPPAAEAPAGERPDGEAPRHHGHETEAPADETDEPELSADEQAVSRTVRAYVEGLDDRDGAEVCSLLAPGTIAAVELPRDRGGCGASVSASIGYRDPRGLPVWKTARVARIPTVEVTGETAKVVVTTVTRFADRKDVSVEDDVVYLERSGDGWLIAKPSSTLYRAVGVADVPPSVLAPPP